MIEHSKCAFSSATQERKILKDDIFTTFSFLQADIATVDYFS